MVEIGMLLPQPMKEPNEVIEYGKNFPKMGFDGIWSPDHIVFSGQGDAPEAWSILNIIGRETKEKTTIGTAVTDPHRYHPAILAQRLATLTHLNKNETVLGLGAGESMNLDPYGIEWDKPVSRMEEALDIIKGLLDSDLANTFDYNGEFYNLENACLQIKPKRDIPIYLAANGPKTRKIAGKKADGWIPVHPSPDLFKKYKEDIKEGLSNRDKNRENFKMAPQIPTVIADDKNEALERLIPFKYVIAWPQSVRDAGYDLEIPEHLKDVSYATINPQDEEGNDKLQELSQLYPDEICLDFSISGTPEDCIEKIEKYEKAGVDHLILLNLSQDFEESLEIYSEKIIPHFK